MDLRCSLQEDLAAFYDELEETEFRNIKESKMFPALFSLSNWVEGGHNKFKIQIEFSNKEKTIVT